MLILINEFEKQWRKYVEVMEKMGRRIDDAKKEFENLTTTRTRQLERPLTRIQNLKLGQDGSSLIEEESKGKEDI